MVYYNNIKIFSKLTEGAVKTEFKAFIAVITLLFFVFETCSCAVKTDIPADSETSRAESEAESGEASENDDPFSYIENDFDRTVKMHLNRIGKQDFGGTTFMIVSAYPEITDPEKCGTVMSQAVYERNLRVENMFNVEIVTKEADPDTLYTELYNACLAGDFYADLITVPQYYITQFSSSGILTNLLSLPFYDYEAGCNIESGVEAGAASDSAYAVASWATLQADKLPCVFFNKDLFAEAGIDYPYKLMRDGEWTWDKFFEYANLLSGDGIASYGAQNTSQNLGDIIYISCDNKFINAGIGNSALTAVDAEGSAEFTDIAYKLFNDENKIKNSLESIDTFASGGAVFLIETLGEAKKLSTSDAVWGILPIPKASAEQESYKTVSPSDSAFFAVPATCSSAEKSSKILAALNAASLGYLVDSYTTESIYYYLRDNASADSVETICYSVYYDMAYSAGTYDLSIANATYLAMRNVYENNHDINFYINSFSWRADNALSRLFP